MKVTVMRPEPEGMRRPTFAVAAHSPIFGKAGNGLVAFHRSSRTPTLTAGGATTHAGITPNGARFDFNRRKNIT